MYLKREKQTTQKTKEIPGTTARYIFLIITAFVCGASIMIIELTGNRVLAPWFGNTIYTWTGLIGVILVCISCGYYLGGYLADKSPNYVIMAHILSISAILTMLIPIFQRGLEGIVMKIGIVIGPVLATILLFALPGCFLAAITPFTIRLISLISEDKKVGISAGFIGMVSTFGSVIGTFCSGFILIPNLSIRMIFLSTGAVLAILALIGYCIFSSKTQKRMQLALLTSFFVAVGTFVYFVRGSISPNVIFEQMTFYQRIRVTETLETNGDKLRTIILDKRHEGAQYIKSREIPFKYQKYWELVRLFCPQLDRAAFLGGGAFAMPNALLDAFPEAQVDVIEIDKKVIETGRKYFRINDYPKMNVVACDARRFLKTSNQKYDFILGDVYNGLHHLPAHLVTVEFFDIVKGHLSQDGVYMMNIIGSAKGKHSILFQSLAKTLLKIFKNVSVFLVDPDNPYDTQNIIVVAADHDLAINSQTAKEQMHFDTISKLLKGYLRPSQYDISNGIIFTDEKNPIDYVIANTFSGTWERNE